MGNTSCWRKTEKLDESEIAVRKAIDWDSPIGVIFSQRKDSMLPKIKDLYITVLAEDADELKKIRIENTTLGSEGCQDFAYLLPELNWLSELTLSNNQIGNDGAIKLCNTFARLTGLRKLHILNNAVGDEGFDALSTTFPFLVELRDISFHCNAVTRKGLDEFCSCLPELTKLNRIDFGHNKLGNRGVVRVAEAAAGCPQLKEFLFDGIGVNEDTMAEIKKLLPKVILELDKEDE